MNKIKTLIGLAAVAAFASIASAQPNYATLATSGHPVDSTIGGTNYAATANPTNGLYESSIPGGSPVTNLVPLNIGLDGNCITIQGYATANTAQATNVQFVITAVNDNAVSGNVTITNNTGTGAAQSKQASQLRSIFATLTLPMINGANNPNSTNWVFTPYSSPPFVKGMTLYLEKIDCSAITNAAAAYVTNYGIFVANQPNIP